MPAVEKLEWLPWKWGTVRTSSARPAPPSSSASHCWRSTGSPKRRCAITARETAPPASTACTREIGAIERAATWTSQATAASSQPAANQGEEASRRALCSGRRSWTGSVSWQPRCLSSEARLTISAGEHRQPDPYLHEIATT